jgi:hypothetical protein
MSRQAIPRQLEREILVETGHRCAIPTCRQIPVEIAHIVPFSDVGEHKFENLIALCPTCHTRYDTGVIDRKSMLQYKANLTILNSRYSDLERRMIEDYADTEREEYIFPFFFSILIKYLVSDGYVEFVRRAGRIFFEETPSDSIWRFTQSGKDFVARWKAAKALDA